MGGKIASLSCGLVLCIPIRLVSARYDSYDVLVVVGGSFLHSCRDISLGGDRDGLPPSVL